MFKIWEKDAQSLFKQEFRNLELIKSMESLLELKKLINEAKNICIIPNQSDEPESLTATLALFYTLKELHKNVNLIIPQLPENLVFLTPSLDFITQPKNFVISIPKNVAEISQVYYEKQAENLKIHLTIEKGAIKKEAISFYFSDAKPDLIITLGIQNFHKELEGKLDSFGFLLDSPIINIDNNTLNLKFGKINLIEEKSLSEIILHLASQITEKPLNKNASHCLLTGLTVYYKNFQDANIPANVFELCAKLMTQGAVRQEIISHLYPRNLLTINKIIEKNILI